MQKKIIGILLMVCLLISLLPMTAMAAEAEMAYVKFGRVQANGSGYEWMIAKGGETYYLTKDTSGVNNYSLTQGGATADNYTVKLEWPSSAAKPTLYLKGTVGGAYDPDNEISTVLQGYHWSNVGSFAELGGTVEGVDYLAPDIVVEGDSTIYSLNSPIKIAGDCTISSKNNAKLTLYHGGNATSGSLAVSKGNLTLDNANLKLDYIQGAAGKGGIVVANGGFTVKNSTLELKTNSVSITATEDILVENSTITSDCDGIGSPLMATETNMTITGSKLTANKTAPWDRGELCVGIASAKASDPTPDVEAVLTITDSEINFTGNMYGFGNYRDKNTKIVLNAGTVIKVQLATINVSGSDTGYAKFMSVEPTFGADTDVSIKVGKDAASAATADVAALTEKIDGTKTTSSKYNPNRYCEITVTKSAVEQPTTPTQTDPTTPEQTDPTEENTEPTATGDSAATTEPTATTGASEDETTAATEPSGTEAQEPADDESEGLSGGVIALIVVGALVLAGGGVGAWFFLKKKKAA